MTDTPNPPQGFSIERGLDLVRAGKADVAILHFAHFAHQKPVTEEVVVAMRQTGVLYRILSCFEPAETYLTDALEAAKRLKKPELAESIHVELVKTWHAIACS